MNSDIVEASLSTSRSRPTHDIASLEGMIIGIRDVTGCRVKVDSSGEIAEIHVTALPGRQPRLIARDVDSLLQVKAGLDLDHRKIGVVIEDAPKPDAPQPDRPDSRVAVEDLPAGDPGELIIEEAGEAAPRLKIQKVSVTHEENQVRAGVTLDLSGQRAVGEAMDADTPAGHLSALIRATLEAVLVLHDTEMRFSDPQFRVLTMGQDEVFVVYLSAVDGRSVHVFSGSSVVCQDTRQTSVMATLDALNRVSGLWPRRETLQYDIL